jgi:hypothetical protein
MKNFIVIYHAPEDAMKQSAEMSPDEMKKGMEPWMVWANKCGDNLVDMGTPLSSGIKLSPDGKSSNSNNGVVGYSILQAENLEGAKSLMEGHPHLQWDADCGIEIHETMPLPGM